jgi:hypothetical protein
MQMNTSQLVETRQFHGKEIEVEVYKTWKECVADDMRKLGLGQEIALFGGMVFWRTVQTCKRGNTNIKPMMITVIMMFEK